MKLRQVQYLGGPLDGMIGKVHVVCERASMLFQTNNATYVYKLVPETRMMMVKSIQVHNQPK